MKIAIVGASGQTGKPLIEEALARGHEVIAIARTPAKLSIDNPRVTVRAGDAFDEASIVAALEGADAVITTVGKTDLRDKRYNLSTAAHRSVMAGMRAHGIKRLLVISSIGAAQGIKRKGMRRNIYLWLRRKYYLDMFQMEEELAASGLDVTILRAPMLYDGPAKHDYFVMEDENYFDVLKISRADLAHFLLEDLESGRWINRRIAISDNETAENKHD
jgi:putative NADH-flavin reductase